MFDGCAEPTSIPVRVGDKWTAQILVCLKDAPRRFNELRRPLKRLTPKVLSESLRSLERNGFVSRTVYGEQPPHVEYALTPLGRSLLEPLAVACAWSREHGEELTRARAAYEAGGRTAPE
ncbi:transcriptional regulator, HxlR family [Cryptosporangium aurantiacum]|uniref:Transcriptional regulator, HxlR family n=2 Tax=Cryptosporangium aurantiacum TaxID=134849 RepID=A0A1M7RDL7_9ACTN|nr:transcriptional regulator, HxlR family [Cryptosporangium aurantiacum]